MRKPIAIGSVEIRAGQRATVDIPVPDLYTHTGITLPVHVVHGKKDGPVLFLSGALHGDEINGVEIIRRILKSRRMESLRGTLLAIPVVNIYGFINKTRYLPDRRDLNRSFPGSETGSLAARMANVFLREIVSKSNYGIDLHTAAIHRNNLPQIRAVMDHQETARIARAFSLPVILNTSVVAGSLRESAEKAGVSVIVYEAGEALRFDEASIRGGVKGIVSVMREVGMLPLSKNPVKKTEAMVAQSSTWIRASQSGILRTMKTLGAKVLQDELMAVISDPFGEREEEIRSTVSGIIIGRTNIPLVNEGEALFHIARFRSGDEMDQAEEMQNLLNPDNYQLKQLEPPIV